MKKPLLSIVIPCYNEEDVLSLFYTELKEILNSLDYEYELIFIDDGSIDNTAKIILDMVQFDSRIQLLSFSRNFGKEAGIYAGLSYSKGDLVVIMDADLQHPPEVIPLMIKEIERGYDSVTTRRINRKGESWLKSILANQFYKLIKKIAATEIVQGSQDFRMMKRVVVNAILSLKEYNRFSKGIFSWVGFKVKYIDIENRERPAGKTKWKMTNLLRYAIEGIVGFSTIPLRFATFFGSIISLIAFLYLGQILIKTFLYGSDVPGYASTIITILFIGGIQLLAMGILAEYLAKVYLEIKNRPKYIVREYILSNKNKVYLKSSVPENRRGVI